MNYHISDVSHLLHISKDLIFYLEARRSELQEKISRETLLMDRIFELIQRQEHKISGPYTGRVRVLPKRYLYRLVNYRNGEFGPIDIPELFR